jgi:hypothetical protein
LEWLAHYIELQAHANTVSGMSDSGAALEEFSVGANFDQYRGTFGERVGHRQVTSVNT